MENRIAVIGIIVENTDSADRLNDILHEYGEYIIGRMGVPYRERGISVISVAVDAPIDVVDALAQKVAALPDVSASTACSNIAFA